MTVDEFAIEWERLVLEEHPLATDPYLEAVARFTTVAPSASLPGAFTKRFVLREDPELDRLLVAAGQHAHLQPHVVPYVFAWSNLRDRLHAFEKDPYALETALREAAFSYIAPFYLEGTLAEFLYGRGMSRRFLDRHSAGDAQQLARRFLASLAATPLEDIVAFQARLPWGHWFDATDLDATTFVIAHRGRRELVLCCFSHRT